MVAPAWGANVIGFSYLPGEATWPVPVLEAVDIATVASSPTSYGMPILGPTPGRVGRNQTGRFEFRGESFSIHPTRHGFLRDARWDIVEQSRSEVVCATTAGPIPAAGEPPSFPYHFRAEHRVRLAARSLSSQVSVHNLGSLVQPVNIGWHPYLHRSGRCAVRLPARLRWELHDDDEPTPTGRLLEVGAADDFRSGRIVDRGDTWDDVFTDLDVEEGRCRCWVEERAPVLARDGGTESVLLRRFVEIEAPRSARERPVRNVQLYTPRGRNAMAIEPLSAPPDAINLLARGHERADVCELEPGEEAIFRVSVGVELHEATPADAVADLQRG